MKYGKIILGTLQVPQNYPCSIEHNGKKIYNPTPEQYLEAGYLPIEETKPELVEGKVDVARYEIVDNKIVQMWSYEDIEEDIPMDSE